MRPHPSYVAAAAAALVILTACGGDPVDSVAPSATSTVATAAGSSSATVGEPPATALAIARPAPGSPAVVRIASGFGSVQIEAADLGDDSSGARVQASGPADAVAPPVLTTDGDTVTVTQPQDGSSLSVLVIRLARRASWQVDLDGGASAVRMDLRTTHVTGVELTQGVSSLTMALPAPTGTLPVRLRAGASSVALTVAGDPPVRAVLDGGAGSVTLFGTTHTGIAGGTVLTTPGWTAAQNRVAVICTAGVSSLAVDREQ